MFLINKKNCVIEKMFSDSENLLALILIIFAIQKTKENKKEKKNDQNVCE